MRGNNLLGFVGGEVREHAESGILNQMRNGKKQVEDTAPFCIDKISYTANTNTLQRHDNNNGDTTYTTTRFA